MKTKRIALAVVILAQALVGAGILLADNSTTPSKPFTFTPGGLIRASELNSDFDALYSGLSNVGTANLLANAITSGKIASGAVTQGKLGSAAVLFSNIDPASQPVSIVNLEIHPTNTSTVQITFAQLSLSNGSTQLLLPAQALPCALLLTGAGGMSSDSTWAVNTTYYIFVISDGVTTNTLASINLSPAMPGSYTYKRRVGAVRTQSTGPQLYQFQQIGAKVKLWDVAPLNTSTGQITAAAAATVLTVASANTAWRPIPPSAAFGSFRFTVANTVQNPTFFRIYVNGHTSFPTAQISGWNTLSATPQAVNVDDVPLITNAIQYDNAGVAAGYSDFGFCTGWTDNLNQ